MTEVIQMSKLLNSVLDKISEDNNEYRRELNSLNNKIDEKTTTLVGDVVTLSGYSVDFSNTVSEAKQLLVSPISRIIEQYVIKDLRSVETVNEQFIEKINDKLETENVNTIEEKQRFNKNLNSLLNDKYLEIVKIKRASFINEEGVNEDVEKVVSDFVLNITSKAGFDVSRLNDVINGYKAEVYALINSTLTKISSLYLNNFVTEVSNALDQDDTLGDFSSNIQSSINDVPKPFMPEINEVQEENLNFESPDLSANNTHPQIPIMPEITPVETENENIVEKEEVNVQDNGIESMSINVPTMEEIKDEEVNSKPKKSYDVEEILKIAKSPIAAIEKDETPKSNDSFVTVEPISITNKMDQLDPEFDAREIVEEMIDRLKNRIAQIDNRRTKYEEDSNKLQEDEAFVNDLIKSAKDKKDELDIIEKELLEKEKELNERQKELDKKINDVMPFANAVLKSEES